MKFKEGQIFIDRFIEIKDSLSYDDLMRIEHDLNVHDIPKEFEDLIPNNLKIIDEDNPYKYQCYTSDLWKVIRPLIDEKDGLRYHHINFVSKDNDRLYPYGYEEYIFEKWWNEVHLQPMPEEYLAVLKSIFMDSKSKEN